MQQHKTGERGNSEEDRERLHSLMAEIARSRKQRHDLRRDDMPERSRALYYMPDFLKTVIGVIADREGLSNSGVATLLLSIGARSYALGTLDLDHLKTPIDHTRYDFVATKETVLEIIHGQVAALPAEGPGSHLTDDANPGALDDEVKAPD